MGALYLLLTLLICAILFPKLTRTVIGTVAALGIVLWVVTLMTYGPGPYP